MDEPRSLLVHAALDAVRPFAALLDERGWDAAVFLSGDADTMDVLLRVRIKTSKSNDTEDTMTPEIDAEGDLERAAFLLENGWHRDPDEARCWRHSRLLALPPLTIAAAFELASASAAETATTITRDPAAPPRHH